MHLWPTEAVFYCFARTEQNKLIKVLFADQNQTHKKYVRNTWKIVSNYEAFLEKLNFITYFFWLFYHYTNDKIVYMNLY